RAVRERADAAVLVAVVNLVPGLPRDPELGAQGRHLLALEQAGNKPEPLVHDVTLLPRHAPSSREGAKCHPCVRNTVLPISQEGQLAYGELRLGRLRRPITRATQNIQ